MQDLGLPDDMFTFINFPTRYDRRELDAMLKGSGIECPNLHDYAWRLWDYWERHLDPALFIDRSLKGTVGGKVVLITGGSSGIGLAAACKFAEAGAITIICARGEEKLKEAVAEIHAHVAAKGGKDAQVFSYSVDIADEAGCAAFVKTLEEQHGGVDYLINNAGRSIRRAIEMLGLDGVRRAASTLRPWPGPLNEAHAAELTALLDRVRLAGRVAQWLRPAGYDPEVVYLLAMLQSLGRLAVQQFITAPLEGFLNGLFEFGGDRMGQRRLLGFRARQDRTQPEFRCQRFDPGEHLQHPQPVERGCQHDPPRCPHIAGNT